MISATLPKRIPTFCLEEQLEPLKPTIEKIQALEFSKIVIPTLRHFVSEFKKQPPFHKVVKVLSFPTYGALLVIGFFSSYASLLLLYNADFSSALSSNASVRVNFANNITNAGALFACVTDFPAISYVLYLYMLRKPHQKAVLELMNQKYHSSINELNLSTELHEELYQRYIAKLQSLNLDGYYLNPDLLSSTGAIYQELAPILNQIDQEIEKGISLSELRVFREESWGTKLAKITVGVSSFAIMALSTFILLENTILIKDTPDGDLFSQDGDAQDAEAFYLTQLGGFFSSLTAFGAAGYLSYRTFVQSAYKKAMSKKIEAAFIAHTPSNLPLAQKNELYRIKEKKLLKLT